MNDLPLQAGIFESKTSLGTVLIRVYAWQPPVFGKFDPDLGVRPRLAPMDGIMVEREVTTNRVGPAIVRYMKSGNGINQWSRSLMPRWAQRRILLAIEETRRLSGGAHKYMARRLRCL